MKKVSAIVCLIVIFLVIYLFQSNFFSWFTISGVKPNIFIIFLLFIGLFVGGKIGISLGLVFGVLLDILIGRSVGITGILFAIIGVLGEKLDKNFSKESRMTIMLMVIGGTLFFETVLYIYNIIKLNIQFEFISFFKILLVEIFYNTIIVIIIYPIMQRLGHVLEEIFKQKNILTRYF